MSGELVWNKEKGEFRIYGRRNVAIDGQALCDYLDSLVGPVVAQVIMNNLESRLGKRDAEEYRAMKPGGTVHDVIDMMVEIDRVSGVGITKATVTEKPDINVVLEIANPAVKGTSGASKAFLFSWWCGALSTLFGKELEATNVEYDQSANVMQCQIAPRITK